MGWWGEAKVGGGRGGADACALRALGAAIPAVVESLWVAGVEGYFWKPEPVTLVRILVRKASAQM
jgi:hypothetical protein